MPPPGLGLEVESAAATHEPSSSVSPADPPHSACRAYRRYQAPEHGESLLVLLGFIESDPAMRRALLQAQSGAV